MRQTASKCQLRTVARRLRLLLPLAVAATVGILCLLPAGSDAATFAQTRTQLMSWRLKPAPLYPSGLPSRHRGVNVDLYRFRGLEYVITFGAPDNADCHTLPNPAGWCVQLRRTRASLDSWLHDPGSPAISLRRMRVGARTVWFFEAGGNAGGWWMVWAEHGRTYGAWAWTGERTALRRLVPFVESLHPLAGAPSPPTNPCAPVRGSIGKRLLASLKCTAAQTVLEAKCAFGIVTLVVPALKALKLIKALKAADAIAKLPEKARPFAKFLYHLYHAQFSSRAPHGFRSFSEVVHTLGHIRTATKLIKLLPHLWRSVSHRDYNQLALDIADLAGLHACVQGVANALN